MVALLCARASFAMSAHAQTLPTCSCGVIASCVVFCAGVKSWTVQRKEQRISVILYFFWQSWVCALVVMSNVNAKEENVVAPKQENLNDSNQNQPPQQNSGGGGHGGGHGVGQFGGNRQGNRFQQQNRNRQQNMQQMNVSCSVLFGFLLFVQFWGWMTLCNFAGNGHLERDSRNEAAYPIRFSKSTKV